MFLLLFLYIYHYKFVLSIIIYLSLYLLYIYHYKLIINPYFTFIRSHSNCSIFIFINKGNCITFFCLTSTCSKFGLSRFCCVFWIPVWLTSYLFRLLTVKCWMLSVVSVKGFQPLYVVLLVFGLITYFESCSGHFLCDFEHVDACLYYMV